MPRDGLSKGRAPEDTTMRKLTAVLLVVAAAAVAASFAPRAFAPETQATVATNGTAASPFLASAPLPESPHWPTH